MTHFEKSLENLTAGDLMSPKLITVLESMTLANAARLLADADVRGAPVVDTLGHCVGVISTSDFMRVAVMADAKPVAGRCGAEFFSPWQMIDPQKLPTDRVREIMSRNPVTVTSETPIAALARLMVDSHVHRLIVVKDGGTLLGIVSATDLLDVLTTLTPEAALATP